MGILLDSKLFLCNVLYTQKKKIEIEMNALDIHNESLNIAV